MGFPQFSLTNSVILLIPDFATDAKVAKMNET